MLSTARHGRPKRSLPPSDWLAIMLFDVMLRIKPPNPLCAEEARTIHPVQKPVKGVSVSGDDIAGWRSS